MDYGVDCMLCMLLSTANTTIVVSGCCYCYWCCHHHHSYCCHHSYLLLLPAAPFLLFLAPQHTTSKDIANAITAAFAVCYHKNPKVLVTAIALDIITTAR